MYISVYNMPRPALYTKELSIFYVHVYSLIDQPCILCSSLNAVEVRETVERTSCLGTW